MVRQGSVFWYIRKQPTRGAGFETRSRPVAVPGSAGLRHTPCVDVGRRKRGTCLAEEEKIDDIGSTDFDN